MSKKLAIWLIAIISASNLHLNGYLAEVTSEKERCDVGEECTAYYLCSNKTIITDGSSVIDSRFSKDDSNETCPTLQVCCRFDGIESKELFELNKLPVSETCGLHNAKGLGGFINGQKNQAQFGEFPWMVAVLEKLIVYDMELITFKCGGSLIHPKVVLSTAHNTFNLEVKNLMARAGEWETMSEDEIFEHVEIDVQNIIRHEEFYTSSLKNNIALIVLKSSFTTSPHINTVCLPPANANFDGQTCFSTGWGKEKFGKDGSYSAILKKIQLPIVPSAKCQQSVRKAGKGKYFRMFYGNLCAGGEKSVDTCTGDGGSPLMCSVPEYPEYFYQVGIVSWGFGCGENGIPAFYVDVSKYRNWIDKNMATLSLDVQYYNFD